MNKRILGGLAVAAMLAGGLALTSGVAQAEQPVGVDHPEDQCDGTFYESLGPNIGTSIVVAYSGDMWIKIGDQHILVRNVTKGQTVTPASVPSWPKDEGKGLNPKEVSHVDYCVKPRLAAPPVLTASYDCVAKLVSRVLAPASSDEWSAGEIVEDTSNKVFSVEITAAKGFVFANAKGSITLTAKYTETTDCEVLVVAPTLTPPNCEAAGGVVATNTAKYTFGNVGNTYTATAATGVRLVGQTVFAMQPLPKVTAGCSNVTQTPPPVVQVNPPAPPAPTQVASSPPVQATPAPAAAAPAAVVPAGGLPSTGIDGTGVTALIALLLTSLGGAALYMSRRYNVMN